MIFSNHFTRDHYEINYMELILRTVNCGGGAFKNQFKKTDKSGAALALILCEQELKANTVAVKF